MEIDGPDDPERRRLEGDVVRDLVDLESSLLGFGELGQ